MSHCCGGSEKTAVFSVQGMTCGHCTASVEKAVSALNRVSRVEADLASKKVSITFDPAKVNEDTFEQAITDQGCKVL